MFGFFDYDKLNSIYTKYSEESPFPHAMLDSIGNDSKIRSVARSFPTPNDPFWYKYDNVFEKKLAQDNPLLLPESVRLITAEMNSKPFVLFLEKLTGERGLITDPHLRGAGMHQISRGGKLDIHADFNWHPKLHLVRRINVLLYLNEIWHEDWGGHLELWDKQAKECKRRISPLFNRMVVFTSTDHSLHGHPDPLACPENTTRKSIAMYYYVSVGDFDVSKHSTMFVKRPWEDTSEEVERFREKRSTFQDYNSNR